MSAYEHLAEFRFDGPFVGWLKRIASRRYLRKVRQNQKYLLTEDMTPYEPEPARDDGEFPIKRIIGDTVIVEADVFTDGHDAISCALLYKKEGDSKWTEVPMEALVNDRWRGSFKVVELGRYLYTVSAWIDRFKTWSHALAKRVAAGQDGAGIESDFAAHSFQLTDHEKNLPRIRQGLRFAQVQEHIEPLGTLGVARQTLKMIHDLLQSYVAGALGPDDFPFGVDLVRYRHQTTLRVPMLESWRKRVGVEPTLGSAKLSSAGFEDL